MSKWWVTATTQGVASCEVEASTYEEALSIAATDGEWENDEWDLNTASHNGGWIDAVEEE